MYSIVNWIGSEAKKNYVKVCLVIGITMSIHNRSIYNSYF